MLDATVIESVARQSRRASATERTGAKIDAAPMLDLVSLSAPGAEPFRRKHPKSHEACRVRGRSGIGAGQAGRSGYCERDRYPRGGSGFLVLYGQLDRKARSMSDGAIHLDLAPEQARQAMHNA